MRAREGPTKNRFWNDRETPSRNGDTMLLLVFRIQNQKNYYKTWSVFTCF